MSIDRIKELFKEENILDIKSSKWEKHSIIHGADCLPSYKKATHLDVAKNFVPKKKFTGIYVYFKGTECF